jgi:hypothetical protein
MTPGDVKTGQVKAAAGSGIVLPIRGGAACWTPPPPRLPACLLSLPQELLREDFIQANPAWAKELELMLSLGVKAEIQSLSSFDFQYLTHTYLPQKLAQGDWL